MDYLAERMVPISLDEFLAARRNGAALPRRAVLITFDDGERSVYEVGLPMLRDRGLSGVVFVVAGLLDTTQPFWWSEVRELAEQGGETREFAHVQALDLPRKLKNVGNHKRRSAIEDLRASARMPASPEPQLRRAEMLKLEAAGIAVGNHTLTHPCLNKCDRITVQNEIAQAHDLLTNALGHAPRAFAYPDGAWTETAAQTAVSLGYEAAFIFDHRHATWPPADPMRISRLRVNSHTTDDRFRIILSGLHPFLHRARTVVAGN